MENCLVTRYKAASSNSKLLKPGEFVVEFGVSESLSDAWNRIIQLGNLNQTEPTELRIIEGDAYFTDSTYTQNLGTTLSTVGDITTYVSNAACKVGIKYNYRVGSMALGYDGYLDISQLKFNQFTVCSAIRILDRNSKSTGSIESFANFWKDRGSNDGRLQIASNLLTGSINAIDFTHVNNFDVGGANNVTGNIETINVSSALTNFNINYTSISGSVETFLVKLLTAGKSGNITLRTGWNNTTWHGVSGGQGGVITATFDTNSISVSLEGTVIGTYNGSTWSYTA